MYRHTYIHNHLVCVSVRVCLGVCVWLWWQHVSLQAGKEESEVKRYLIWHSE